MAEERIFVPCDPLSPEERVAWILNYLAIHYFHLSSVKKKFNVKCTSGEIQECSLEDVRESPNPKLGRRIYQLQDDGEGEGFKPCCTRLVWTQFAVPLSNGYYKRQTFMDIVENNEGWGNDIIAHATAEGDFPTEEFLQSYPMSSDDAEAFYMPKPKK